MTFMHYELYITDFFEHLHFSCDVRNEGEMNFTPLKHYKSLYFNTLLINIKFFWIDTMEMGNLVSKFLHLYDIPDVCTALQVDLKSS